MEVNEIKDKITLSHIFYTFWGWLMFIIVNIAQLILLPFIIFLTSPFDKNRVIPAYVIKFFSHIFYFLNFVEKNDINPDFINPPKKNERRIYALNHASMFDVILMYMLPGPIKSIMKKSYVKMPLIGWISVLAGNVLVDDDNRVDVYYEVVKKLEAGCPFVIFPEGTKSKNSKIGKFQHGTFKMALETKADIVPVVFDTWNVIRPGAYWIRDVKPTFRILEPLKYEKIKEYSYKTLSDIVRLKLLEGLTNLREERRNKDKKYYRNNKNFILLDNEMVEEAKLLREKLISNNVSLI